MKWKEWTEQEYLRLYGIYGEKSGWYTTMKTIQPLHWLIG